MTKEDIERISFAELRRLQESSDLKGFIEIELEKRDSKVESYEAGYEVGGMMMATMLRIPSVNIR